MNKYSQLSISLTKKLTKTEKKENGIYFTPSTIIITILKILEGYNFVEILEPACGSCEFIKHLDNSLANCVIDGIELNKTIYNEIKDMRSNKNSIRLIQDDFLKFKTNNQYDLVIGSRYKSGINVVNWPLRRLFLSYFANVYSRIITGLPIKDSTGGFKCFNIKVLESINLDKIKSSGYSFQIEMNFITWVKKYTIKEIPIIFCDRSVGESKMSKKIIFEAIYMVPLLRIKKILGILN